MKKKNLKIAVVHDFLTEMGGAEKVLLDILEIYPQADLYTLFYDQKKLGSTFDKYEIKTSFLQKYPKFLKGAYLRPLSPVGIESLDLSNYDLIISNCNSFAKGVISNPKTKHISYIHSPTRYLWDYYHDYLKEHNLQGIRSVLFKPLFSYLRLWDKVAANRPDYLFANSKNVQKRIKKFYDRSSTVIYPGTDTDKYYADKKGNYFLIVSRLSKYKNVDLAVSAFNKLNQRLLVIGAGPERKRLEKKANSNIEFLGFKSDKVLKSYYSRAKGFIFPQEEDFGLTPIEAMASGVPIIAYKKGGALETIKEGETGIFFEKQTVESLKEAVNKFLKQEKTFGNKKQKIQKQAEKFSVNKFKNDFKKQIDNILENEEG